MNPEQLKSLLRKIHAFLFVKVILARDSIIKLIHFYFLIISIASIGLVIYEFGYVDTQGNFRSLGNFYIFALFSFFIRFGFQLVSKEWKQKNKGAWYIQFLIAFFLFFILILHFLPHNSTFLFPILKHSVFIYLFIAFFSVYELSAFMVRQLSKKFNPTQLFVFSFLIIISVGTGLLMLPNSSAHGLGFTNALFISTSAVCVTGLTPIDISTELTFTGHVILLLLIQIGGLGIMTFASFLGIFYLGKTSYSNQIALKQLVNTDSYNNIFKILRDIILTTFSIELIGMIFIYSSLGENSLHNLWVAVFHSVSAFCNAGFSLYSENLFSPIVSSNYFLHITIAILIIFGGLGFPIIFNYGRLFLLRLRNVYFRLIRLPQKISFAAHVINVSTKLVITTTLILLIGGTLAFFVSEYSTSLAALGLKEKLVTSFFMSVSTRTAGFSTLPMNSIGLYGLFFLVLLMWIGASPGSTGGGIKTTAFALACLNIFQIIRGKTRLEIGKREISSSAIQKAFAIIFLSIFVIILASSVIVFLEPRVPLQKIVFEVVSALGTVGLSLDLTPHLSDASKYVITFVMFVGRVGLMTILLMFAPPTKPYRYSYPKEKIILY